MKLMVCIAHKRYGGELVKRLSPKGYRVTKLASTGGFVKKGNDTLLIGVANEDLEKLQNELKEMILELEKEKGWEPPENRLTTFVIPGQNHLAGHA